MKSIFPRTERGDVCARANVTKNAIPKNARISFVCVGFIRVSLLEMRICLHGATFVVRVILHFACPSKNRKHYAAVLISDGLNEFHLELPQRSGEICGCRHGFCSHSSLQWNLAVAFLPNGGV